jgi:hypothetical protein
LVDALFRVWHTAYATFDDLSIQDIVLTDYWQRHSLTITATQDVVDITVMFVNDFGAARASTFYLDGVQVEKKAYATSYCDGSLGTGYAWTGSAHASASTRESTLVYFSPDNGRIDTVSGAMLARAYTTHRSGSGVDRVLQIGAYGGADGDTYGVLTRDDARIGMFNTVDGLQDGSVLFPSGAVFANDVWRSPYMDWSVAEKRVGIIGGTLTAEVKSIPAYGSVQPGFNGSFWIMSDVTADTSRVSGYAGPVATYDRPLTDEELDLIEAAIDEYTFGFLTLYTPPEVLGSVTGTLTIDTVVSAELAFDTSIYGELTYQ